MVKLMNLTESNAELDALMISLNADAQQATVEEDVIVIDEPETPETISDEFVEKKLESIEKAELAEKEAQPKKTRAQKSGITYKNGFGAVFAERVKDSTVEAEEIKFLKEKLDDKTFFTQKKVCEKVIYLFSWLTGKAVLNTVLEIAFKTLKRDGYLEGGKKGNLYKALLEKPYSPGTANAQMGQVMNMFPKLNLTSKEGHKMTANAESNLLYLIYAKMGL